MSDLQIVLIIIGGIIIAAVLIYNWWQERRFLKQIENNFSQFKSESDTLHEAEQPALRAISTPAAKDKFDDEDFTISPVSLHGETPPTETRLDETLLKNTTVEDHENQAAEFTMPPVSSQPKAYTNEPVVAIPDQADISEALETSLPADETVDHQSPSVEMAATVPDTALNPPAEEMIPNGQSNFPEQLYRQIDLIAVLELQEEKELEELITHLHQRISDFDKPMLSFAWVDSEWLSLQNAAADHEKSSTVSSRIALGLQLADRAGAIAKSSLNRFQQAVEALAQELHAQATWQNTEDPVAEAAALDAFCIEVDKTMGFHLLHGESGPFTGTKLRGLAEAQGMALAADGSFKYYDAQHQSLPDHAKTKIAPMFIMFNREHNPFGVEMLRNSVVKSITFQLDIPHTTNCIEAFNQMVLVARQIATGLNAQLVDDNNRALNEIQIEKIRQQLNAIQATMQTRGILTGSELARRLFS